MADPFARALIGALPRSVSPFYQRFLREGRGWLRRGGPQIHLAAFGKHPGWNDHMDDLGLETQTLVMLKRLLYLQGIAGNISAGTWERLEESERLPGFDHVFRWQRRDEYLLGRIWSSSDGKGRGHFPMILCAHVFKVPSPPVSRVEEHLEAIREQCAATASPDEVRNLIAAGLESLRGLAPTPGSSEDEAAHVAVGELPEFAGYRRGEFHRRGAPPPAVIRFDAAKPDLGRWLNALREELDPETPVLLCKPLYDGADWLDVILGEPTVEDFLFLRAMHLTHGEKPADHNQPPPQDSGAVST